MFKVVASQFLVFSQRIVLNIVQFFVFYFLSRPTLKSFRGHRLIMVLFGLGALLTLDIVLGVFSFFFLIFFLYRQFWVFQFLMRIWII